MKTIEFVRFLSILSYFLIILVGQIIAIPFICWLLFTTFDIGNIDQIFAIFSILGIALNFTKWKSKISITILSFLFMLSPLLSRIFQVPLVFFDYPAFKIPLFIFTGGYLVFIALNARKETLQKI